jgi:hypothetical protein
VRVAEGGDRCEVGNDAWVFETKVSLSSKLEDGRSCLDAQFNVESGAGTVSVHCTITAGTVLSDMDTVLITPRPSTRNLFFLPSGEI